MQPTHRRFISPRPSGGGTKLYIHDNSLKCRANQQHQQQRVLSSFSASSNNTNGSNNIDHNTNCSNMDGTNLQIQQTPSILAAATLPRNFNNQGNYLK